LAGPGGNGKDQRPEREQDGGVEEDEEGWGDRG